MKPFVRSWLRLLIVNRSTLQQRLSKRQSPILNSVLMALRVTYRTQIAYKATPSEHHATVTFENQWQSEYPINYENVSFFEASVITNHDSVN